MEAIKILFPVRHGSKPLPAAKKKAAIVFIEFALRPICGFVISFEGSVIVAADEAGNIEITCICENEVIRKQMIGLINEHKAILAK